MGKVTLDKRVVLCNIVCRDDARNFKLGKIKFNVFLRIIDREIFLRF